MNKVKAGFFSFVEVTDPSAHRSYNEWHQMDHMPEQYPIPGITFGQRWVATPACQSARSRVSPGLGAAHYVALYLMAEPVQETLTEFEELGSRLSALGRFHRQRQSHLFGAWQLLEAQVAPRVLISPEAVPFRPCRGVYTIVEQPAEGAGSDGWIRRMHEENLPAIVDVPGVVGAWTFATSPRWTNERWRMGQTRITVCWLDEDPCTVAAALEPVLQRRWVDAPVSPLLAGPWETITPWEWGWFDQGAATSE